MGFSFKTEFFVGSALALFVLFSFMILLFIRLYQLRRGEPGWWDLTQRILRNDPWVGLSFFLALVGLVAVVVSIAITAAARRSPGFLSSVAIYSLEFAQVSMIWCIY